MKPHRLARQNTVSISSRSLTHQPRGLKAWLRAVDQREDDRERRQCQTVQAETH